MPLYLPPKSLNLRLIHTGELHYPCTHCPYRARTKYALLVHERAHTGIRPLTCPHCPATFLNSSNLASHKRRHMPPAYHCQMCAKGFRFKEVRILYCYNNTYSQTG